MHENHTFACYSMQISEEKNKQDAAPRFTDAWFITSKQVRNIV